MLEFKNSKSEYWNQFSEKDAAFENEVRRGIWLRVDGIKLLPEPPKGYYWAQDVGGLTNSNKITYRLWNNRFGYMPKAE